MDNQLKLMRHFHILGFNFLFIISILTISCLSRNPDHENHLVVFNSTNDSLLLQFTKKYISDTSGPAYYLPPFKEYILTSFIHSSGMEMIRENFGNNGDTVEIYRNDSLKIKWGGPLRIMPDSINHFYNENSWETKISRHDNEYTISTFTISEKDLE